ncbi:MAG: hypothetical protein KKH88_04675 [Nanoarchaeota archaeon]|nr:hypothetical protein [Nanoarchaeota archaeon]MBU1444837.1 hypothetical protein [Nanoarchaeota archaeon]MBU2420005.1 hypothetical protein [Nanoarchaeota archaeon]MBU2475428.1 hypothetical protein [Nanoarchaeota archaeon]MBU3941194.1 hypothetical protein [Nanoarchaeota archaeon]
MVFNKKREFLAWNDFVRLNNDAAKWTKASRSSQLAIDGYWRSLAKW